jgi:hypothetical protein
MLRQPAVAVNAGGKTRSIVAAQNTVLRRHGYPLDICGIIYATQLSN